MSNVAYDRVIGYLDKKAYKIVIENLYPYMGYRALKQKDVRAVDLEEWMYKAESRVSKGIRDAGGSIQYYSLLLKKSLSEFTECQEGSRAKKYYNRAMEQLDAYCDIHSSAYKNDIEDALLTFVSLFRGRKENPKGIGSTVFTAINPFPCIDDISVLKFYLDNDDLFWKDLLPKQAIWDNKEERNRLKKNIKLYFYATSLIHFADIMQDYGILQK